VLSHFSKRKLESITNNQIIIVIINTCSHNLPIIKEFSQSKRKSPHRHQSTRQRSTSHHSRSPSLASRAARKTGSSCLSQTAVTLLGQWDSGAACHPCCPRSADIYSTDTAVLVVAYAKDIAGTTIMIVSFAVVHLVVRAGGCCGMLLGLAASCFLVVSGVSLTVSSHAWDLYGLFLPGRGRRGLKELQRAV
jgi:hypothetical protein